jgi:hypothetical protein
MKSLILCADGTWNTPHGDSPTTTDTNVRKLYCALSKDQSQLKYYNSGVGTNETPLDHLSGGAMGEALPKEPGLLPLPLRRVRPRR